MGNIILQVLGCGDALSSGGQYNTCFYFKDESIGVLVDFGVTSFLSLKKNNIKTSEIDVIAISHFHGDHFGGLPFFLLEDLKEPRSTPLTIIGPQGLKSKVVASLQLQFPGSESSLTDVHVNFIELKDFETANLPHFKLKIFPVIHSAASHPYGFKIWMRDTVIGYSGDTEWTDELIEIAFDADIFICQCTYFSSQKDGHGNYKTLSAKVPLLKYKNILLTHFSDEMLLRKKELNLSYAEDGKVIYI